MFAVLHIPDFALQAVLRTESDTPGKPAALFTDNTKKSLVLARTPAARAAGIALGMTAPQAVARCPNLLIRTPDAAAEAEARATVLAVGFTVAPAIEDTAPGVCTIDLKGAAAAHYEKATAAAVRQLEKLGFAASAGIAPTPLLALYAARKVGRVIPNASDAGRGLPPPPRSESCSRTAGSGDPALHRTTAVSPVCVITDVAAFLAPMPIEAADPSPALAAILQSWGLRTFGDLAALSRDDIGRRLGPDGLALWDRVHGGEPRPLRPVDPPQTFAAKMEFEDEIETLEPLLFILRRFLERIALELRTAGYVAAQLELTLTLADDTEHARPFRLPEPTAEVEILFRAVHTHLESLRTEASIAALALRAEPTRPLVRQHGLFDTGLRDPHGFAETLARIVAIVGSDRVGTPLLEDTHRPDAVKLVTPSPVIPPAAAPPVHAPLGLPLRRFRPPLAAQLELTDGRPTYLWTEQFHSAVVRTIGPWLSSGNWWQSEHAWRRIEYDIALENGGLYRLVLVDRSWFIEGEYD